LTPMCGGFLEPRRLGLQLLKFTFNTENSICRLSWSISSHFGANYSWSVCCSLKSLKITKTPILGVQGHWSWCQSQGRMRLPCTVSEIRWPVGSKSPIFIPPFHLAPSIKMTPFECCEKLDRRQSKVKILWS